MLPPLKERERESSSSFPLHMPSSSSHLITGRPSSARKDTMKASNGYAPAKKVVRYSECRRNHAASIGGYAVDGCREFMASGEEGTSAALRCAACSCHRSFHKREVEPMAETAVARDCSSNSNSSSGRRN